MKPVRLVCLIVLGTAIPAIVVAQNGIPLSPRATPKQAAVAETGLLMEGLASPNYKGLEKMLRARPEDAEAWTFIRGQALLVAETGNLLMLRPPKNQGQDVWNKSSTEMREAATRLARAAAAQDLNTARARLVEVANACTKCHQAFGVGVVLAPFRAEDKPIPMPPP